MILWKLWKGLNAILILSSISEQLSFDHPDYLHADQVRKILLDSFSKFDQTSKKIVACPSRNKTEKRLQAAIQAAANQYLQEHMLRLARLPRIPRKEGKIPMVSSEGRVNSMPIVHESKLTASMRRNTTSAISQSLKAQSSKSTSQYNSVNDAPNSLQAEATNLNMDDRAQYLRDKLKIYRNQYDQVQQYLEQSSIDQKAENIDMLKQNLEDISNEIEKIRNELQEATVEDGMSMFGFGMMSGLNFDNEE